MDLVVYVTGDMRQAIPRTSTQPLILSTQFRNAEDRKSPAPTRGLPESVSDHLMRKNYVAEGRDLRRKACVFSREVGRGAPARVAAGPARRNFDEIRAFASHSLSFAPRADLTEEMRRPGRRLTMR